MKILKFLVIICCTSFFFSSCKKDNFSQDIREEIKTFYSLKNRIAKEFQNRLSDTVTNEYANLEGLLEWIKQQPEVAEVKMSDVYVFDVKHTNGISGNIIFTPKQSKGALVSRGGGGKTDGVLREYKKSKDEKILTNKKVLVILQYADDFYKPYCLKYDDAKHIQIFLDHLEYSDIDFEVTLKVDEGISAFMDMSDYGLIFVNTHGTPDGLMSGTNVFSTDDLIAFSDDVDLADLPDNAASKLRDEELKLTSLWEFDALTQQMSILNES